MCELRVQKLIWIMFKSNEVCHCFCNLTLSWGGGGGKFTSPCFSANFYANAMKLGGEMGFQPNPPKKKEKSH